MARTFSNPGHTITFTAPSGGVVAGTPVLVGTKVAIPQNTVAQTLPFEGMICGVHSVPKADSQAWTEGAAVYWDNTNKVFTTTSSGNTAAGFATAAVASTAGLTTGLVLLNGLPGPSSI